MENNIVYKTEFSDLERVSLMNCNTKINFHHWLDILFLFSFEPGQMPQLVKDETSDKKHQGNSASLCC